MAVSVEEKILRKEVQIEKIKDSITEKKEKLSVYEKELVILKEEKELQQLLKVKKAFSSEDDIEKLIKAIENKDVESIKSLIEKNE